jgi:hypothetical protein
MTQPNDSAEPGSSSLSTPGAPAEPAAIQAAPPPPTPTGIQTAPDKAGAEKVILPTPAPEPKRVFDPEKARRRAWVIDAIQVVLVLALAFLSASFPIRNSDLFMHMGTGRLLVQGKVEFGKDPFSVSSANAIWVNHSWLFDLGSYGLYLAADGEGLVIMKAVVIVLLAAVLLLIRRAGQPLWIPAVCTGLAVLAISTRILFQPIVLSYLFLALTLFILTLRSTHGAERRKLGEKPTFLAAFAAWPYRLYLLPVLFALWANLDAWFLLGPITVGLYLLGEMLQEAINPVPRGPDAPEHGEVRRLGWVLLLGVGACLLNPQHYRVFQIPTEISPALAPEIRNDPALERMFWSPWDRSYFNHSGVKHSLADMAYYPLLVISLLSFVVNRRGWRWWRALIWVAFAALSAYHMRSVPFFAVVAAPIMALNFQDALSARRAGKHAAAALHSPWPIAGRVVSALLLAIVVAAAWPGWLHGLPDDAIAENHRVGWSLEVDPALVEIAQQLAHWREEGNISGEQNAFNLHPDVANYLAFFCPEEKSSFDYRFLLFNGPAATTYYEVRDELNPQLGGAAAKKAAGGNADWRKVFRDHHIRHLLVYDPDQKRTFAAIGRIYEADFQQEKERLRKKVPRAEGEDPPARPREWTLIAQRGRVAVFAWSDPKKGRDEALEGMEEEPNRLAFGPHAVRAPGEGAGRGPATPEEDWLTDLKDWWDKYATRRPPHTPDSYEARFHWYVGQYVGLLEAQQAQLDRAHTTAEQFANTAVKQIAAVAGFPKGALSVPEYILTRLINWSIAAPNLSERFSSSARTLLAIRAARRALAVNPLTDDSAYFWLALAYEQLPEASRNELLNPQSLLAELRRCQIAGCLYNAAKLRPDWLEVHRDLARLYLAQNFYDLGLQQLKEELRLTEETGPMVGEESDLYKQRLKRLGDNVKDLEEKVKIAQNDYLIATKDWPKVLPKAQMALKRGLAGEASADLVKTSPVDLGPDGLLLELRLLLAIGRVEDVRANWTQDLTDNPQMEMVGPYSLPIFKWLLIVQSAAVGDYDKADATLAQVMATIEKSHLEPMPRGLTPLICMHLNAPFLDPVGLRPLPWQAFQRNDLFMKLQQMKRFSLVPPALPELAVLRGLLALEVGDTQRAAEHFRTGLELSWPPRRYLPYFSVLGSSTCLGVVTSLVGNMEATQGLILPLPSRGLAVEYLRLLEEASK